MKVKTRVRLTVQYGRLLNRFAGVAAYNHPRLQPTKVVYLPSVLLLQYDDDSAVNDN